ncbi:MAG: hypothetical protein MUF23_18120 [Pirellula sp.]|jgi:hypothetical protein|nr:hypothetical protein [Pirellula sp.]
MAEAVEDPFEEQLKLYPIDFVLPPRVREELQRKGTGAAIHNDNRESPRFRTNGPAILTWISSPPAVDQSHTTCQVIVRDISKTGVGILTSSQWFPEQLGKLEFAVGEMTVKVMRSRRIGPRCFEVGARILKFSRHDDE